MLPDRETAMVLLKDAPADPLGSDLNVLHSTVTVTVVPEGMHLTRQEIYDFVYFQEQYFTIHIVI